MKHIWGNLFDVRRIEIAGEILALAMRGQLRPGRFASIPLKTKQAGVRKP